MRSRAILFQFDIREVLRKLRGLAKNRVGAVTLNLPFFSISVSPNDREKQIARELVVRLKDRRVLSASECCDDCIDQSLTSLQEIRRLLVDKEVALSGMQDSPVYLLIEAMALGIRQFLTYEQVLKVGGRGAVGAVRELEIRQRYFEALEILRGHLSHCLGQVAAVAGMDVPRDGLIRNYQGAWQIEAYQVLEVSKSQLKSRRS